MKKEIFYFFAFCLLISTSCAKRGSISGGLKDTIAPVLRISLPKNYSTNFKGESIKLTFDEYIKLKDINKQLIISPPLAKKPQILPLTASKTITVNFLEPLSPDTTYSLNFGQSIEDNNESNPYPQFKYVFSTGPYIDSLSINGNIKDALGKKPDTFVNVMLYEINDKYNDSVVYKENPRYVTNTLDSTSTFKIENIKAGRYRLAAMKDNNNDYKFDSKTEKIGFVSNVITIPNDSIFDIKLFKEVQPFKAIKPIQSSANSAIFGYEGNAKDVKLTLKKGDQILPLIATKIPKKDSLQLWFKPIKVEKSSIDSLKLYVVKDSYSKDFIFRVKNQKTDTLNITSSSRIVNLGEMATLNSNIPIEKADESKIQLINKDSVAVPFKMVYDEQNLKLKIDFKKEPLEKYSLTFMPDAITSFIGDTNKKELTFGFETKNTSDYGNLRIDLENVSQFPIIIELTDKNGEIQFSYYAENDIPVDFNLIKPEIYTLRAIYDDNKNGVWDSGNFLEKRQSEEVIYFPKDIDVRANWDVQQTFSLKR